MKGPQGFKDLKDKLRHNAHPTDLIYNSLVYAKDKITEGIALKNIKNFNFNASKIDTLPIAIMYAIGESSRATNWNQVEYKINLLRIGRKLFCYLNSLYHYRAPVHQTSLYAYQPKVIH